MTNKKIIISVIIAIVLCVGIIVGALIYFNLPNVAARNAIFGFVEDLLKRDEIKPLINATNGGSLKFEAGEIGNDIGGKIYFSENESYLESFYVRSNGEKISFDLFLGEDRSYLTFHESLEKSVGFIKGEAATSFEDSIFAYGSGSKYEIDKYSYDSLIEILESYDKSEKMQNELKELCNDYIAFFIQTIEKHAEYESKVQTVEVGKKYIDARVISLSFDHNALQNIIDDILYKAENDPKLFDFAVEYDYYFESFVELIGATVGETAEDSFDNLFYLLDTRSEEFLKDMEYDTLLLELVTPDLSSKLLKFNVCAETEDKKRIIFGLDVGETGIRNSDLIQIRSGNIAIHYEIRENSDEQYFSAIKAGIITSKKYPCIAQLLIDKKANTYSLSMMNSFSSNGSYIIEKGKISVDAREIRQNGKSITDFICRFELSQKDRMPRPINKNDIPKLSELTEEDIKKLLDLFN